jgi:alkylated DNA repair dioxygenase AlkB
MYDRVVKTPRLVGQVAPDAHPVIPDLIEVLSGRYGVRLDRVSAGWYRTGVDSVAWHGDRIARNLPHSIVATVSLGGPRRFLIRPKSGGQSTGFDLGRGDLVVMGGACQRLWEHTIPKTAAAPPRSALMFRHSYDSTEGAGLR